MPETIITLLAKARRTAKRKSLVRPRRRPDEPGRRRLNEPQIRFYDLGQVNHQSLSAAAVWEDHPILKTPTYTTEYTTWGTPSNNFAGVRYLLQPFENADFSAYTDMMFNYPVTEWRQRYRRITGVEGYTGSSDYGFDMRFSLRDSTYSGSEEMFMPERLLSLSYLGQPTFNNQKEQYLTDFHHFWHNDRSYAGYRDLDQLTGQYNISTLGEAVSGGYFPYSTDNAYFKVTASNDPNAAAVTLGTPSGTYDIFLMPQIGFYMATANSADWKTTEVLGLCYQVMPRHLWPSYVEGFQTGSGGEPGSDSAVESWMNYQIARTGMQFSTWVYTGTGGGGDYSYTETPGVPADWTGLSQWGSAVNGDNTNLAGYFYAKQFRGGFTGDNQVTYSTLFRGTPPDANFGNALFRCDEPFLTAVIQKGGSFYYVWDISHTVDPFGNFSCSETIAQHDRFRLSRNIDWTDYEGDPLPSRDGNGPFFAL